MRHLAWLFVVSVTDIARAEPANAVWMELGMAAPGGVIALRANHRLADFGLAIEPAVGVGYTGLVGSLLLAQELARLTGTKPPASLEVYGGYSVGLLNDTTRAAFSAHQGSVPNGAYHFVDAGMLLRGHWKNFFMVFGGGLSFLVARPGAELVEDEWFVLTPEWWLRRRVMPVARVGLGYAF